MENEFERLNLRTLLEIYMEESKKFSTALRAGASWQALLEKRVRIRSIGLFINKKYDELSREPRCHNQPLHGD